MLIDNLINFPANALDLTPFSSVSIVDFEQVNVSRDLCKRETYFSVKRLVK